MLTIKNLDVYYDKLYTLKKISLHIKKGEIITLIGSNGAGKTTLLNTISGLIKPASGNILFEGKEISNETPEKIVKLGISQVPEGRLIFKTLTVEENLLLGAYSQYSFGRKKHIMKDIDTVYSLFAKLKERRKQLAGTLSGGEQQMLAIGRALMSKPKLLLLDEPSMGLAPNIIKEVFQHIIELKKLYGLTVLLVEQNAKSALKIADRGYVLETGRVILEGSAEDLLLNRDVQRAYLGRDLDAEERI
ncbi:MAG: ABC transporter ATP-binding protein [Thermodesulfovibrio sp.]|nr:ABC transporter ATP-binding protein [Thermodesulfovibrio sp.]